MQIGTDRCKVSDDEWYEAVVAARAKSLGQQEPKPKRLGAFCVVAGWLVFCLYVWVGFVKLCVWAGQFTWP